jgi:hypothetical protein
VEEALNGVILDVALREVFSNDSNEVNLLLLVNVVGVLLGILVNIGVETEQAPVMDGTASTPVPIATILVPQFAAGAIRMLKLS